MIRVVLIILIGLIAGCTSDPGDEEMEKFFQENRNKFEEIVSPSSDCFSSTNIGPRCAALKSDLNIFSIGKDPFIPGAITLDFNEFTTQNKGFLYSLSGEVGPLYKNLDKCLLICSLIKRALKK